MVPGFTQSVSVFPVNIFWVCDNFNSFSDDAGIIFMGVCCNFCLVKFSTMFGLYRMFGYY